MSRPASLTWFARHELSLVWRDWVSLMTAGKRKREPLVAAAIIVFAGFAHLMAYFLVVPLVGAGIDPDKSTLAIVTGSAFLSWSLMLSQAMESVTRAFYTRADLDLILSSPASTRRVFAIRIGAISLSTVLLAMLLAGPFINAMAVFDGPRWLAAYGVLIAMGAVSAAFAVTVTVAMFRSLGPKRTRLISQIVAAVVGAAFVIGVQAAAILSYGTFSRISILRSDFYLSLAPEASSLLWAPARAAMGEVTALVPVLGGGLGLLALAVLLFAPRFGEHVVAAAGVDFSPKQARRRRDGFRQASTKRALRHKEWILLRRDPWLVSQSLMQVLYLLPPGLLLWRNFGDNIGTLVIMVPVLVMAAGQLAGGLAWLAVSGEDAPDLVASAPLPARAVVWAKIEAVQIVIAVVIAPLVIGLALAAPFFALAAALGVAVSAASATTIQIWFRAQAKRSNFRRRQTSSRVATLAEALSSVLWAGTAGLAAVGSWAAAFVAAIALAMLAVIWMIRPRQGDL
jgi:ABC-2 type transport system permease protein